MHPVRLSKRACERSAAGVGVLVSLAAAIACCGADPCARVGNPETLDLSGFERFSFRRGMTFSPCQQTGVAHAELIREPDGSISCRGAVFDIGDGPCPELRRIRTRTLNDQEQAAVLDAFRQLQYVPIPRYATILSGFDRPTDLSVEGGTFDLDGIELFGPVNTELCTGGLTRESYDPVVAALSAVLPMGLPEPPPD